MPLMKSARPDSVGVLNMYTVYVNALIVNVVKLM